MDHLHTLENEFEKFSGKVTPYGMENILE